MSNKIIDDQCDWFAGQINLLYEQVKSSEFFTHFGAIEWPYSPTIVHEQDVISTSLLLAKQYPDSIAKCTLLDIDYKLNKLPADIDYFFIRMHVLGHVIIDKIRPYINLNKLHDVSLVEVTSLFFAAITCHKYYGMKDLTPYMAREIAMALYDMITVDNTYGTLYNNQDYIDLCEKMLEALMEDDTKLLN